MASGSPFESQVGFSRAVRVGEHVWVAGTAPIWPNGRVDPDPAAQARRCLEIIDGALREAGAELTDVVRTRIYLVDAVDFPAVAEVHGRFFGAIRPVCTGLVVAALLDPAWRVEIEADAITAPPAT